MRQTNTLTFELLGLLSQPKNIESFKNLNNKSNFINHSFDNFNYFSSNCPPPTPQWFWLLLLSLWATTGLSGDATRYCSMINRLLSMSSQINLSILGSATLTALQIIVSSLHCHNSYSTMFSDNNILFEMISASSSMCRDARWGWSHSYVKWWDPNQG